MRLFLNKFGLLKNSITFVSLLNMKNIKNILPLTLPSALILCSWVAFVIGSTFFIMDRHLYTIDGFDNYFITKNGDVYSIARNRFKKLKLSPHFGYIRISLTANKERVRILAHRLVAKTFIPNPNNKPHVNHINGVKNDNRVENLEWCTFSENLIHAYTILRRRAANEKFTPKQIIKIRTEYTNGINMVILAKKYHVAHSTISEIINKKRYKYI